jgi:phosphohistidine phosphatase
MKRLVIIRHAKTEQGGYDHDLKRELTDTGKDDAYRISDDLKNREIIPQYIISSPATRAITTARIFAEELNFPKEKIIEKKGLYFDYTTQDFLNLIQEVPDNVNTLFVFGHNPFVNIMAENLSKNFEGDMPTCSTVVLDFNVEKWSAIEARQGNLFLHLYPKNYK